MQDKDKFSFSDWQNFLRGMSPLDTWNFYSSSHGSKKPFAKKYEFNCAVMDRFENMQFLSSVLDAEDISECRKSKESIEKYILNNFFVQKERFIAARTNSNEYYQKFGSSVIKKHMYEAKLIDGLGDPII